MNKGLQIVLLGVLFLVSGAVGYILEDVLIENKGAAETAVQETVAEPVAPQDTVSTVPVIMQDGISAPKRAESGKYGFSVQASVESAHQLKYLLYSDEACTQEVASNLSGVFADIPAAASRTYYVRVQNVATGDLSEVVPVEGFVQLVMYQKITKAELEKLINEDRDWGAAPKGFNDRIATPISITVSGLKPDERGVTTVPDICLKTSNNWWSSVVVENIGYDGQGRMNKLAIKVNR